MFAPNNPLGVASKSSAQSSGSIGLSLTVNPSVLPADGGTYSAIVLEFKNTTSGAPFIPQSAIKMLLTYRHQTGNVPSSVTFPAGDSFLLVNFSTTTLPGSTVISAIAPRYLPASQTVVTKNIGGMPYLQVFLSPNQTPPNEKMNSTVVVQVLDSSGNPQKTDSPVTVELAIEYSTIGSVSPTIVIPPGSTFAHVTLNVSLVSGTTNITTFTTGFASAQTGLLAQYFRFKCICRSS